MMRGLPSASGHAQLASKVFHHLVCPEPQGHGGVARFCAISACRLVYTKYMHRGGYVNVPLHISGRKVERKARTLVNRK